MCGPSSQQEGLAASESSFSKLLQGNYNQRFGSQSQVFNMLQNAYTPIAEAGPDQQGFGPQELAALNTQAGEGVAANYAKAGRALNTSLATRGGGSEVLPTGAAAELKGSLANAGAGELSQEQLGITRANYAQGRDNYNRATAGLDALAGQYNPNAIAGEASGANQDAFGEATKIQDMKNQKQAAIAGGISSLAMTGLTFGAGALTGFGGASGFAGGMNALKG